MKFQLLYSWKKVISLSSGNSDTGFALLHVHVIASGLVVFRSCLCYTVASVLVAVVLTWCNKIWIVGPTGSLTGLRQGCVFHRCSTGHCFESECCLAFGRKNVSIFPQKKKSIHISNLFRFLPVSCSACLVILGALVLPLVFWLFSSFSTSYFHYYYYYYYY